MARPPPTLGDIEALAAEALGSLLLFACVIGSGVMAERLAGGNVAVALLGNTLATAAMLVVLVSILGPVSGAHLNPAVTFVAVLRRELRALDGAAYVAAQLVGGLAEGVDRLAGPLQSVAREPEEPSAALGLHHFLGGEAEAVQVFDQRGALARVGDSGRLKGIEIDH